MAKQKNASKIDYEQWWKIDKILSLMQDMTREIQDLKKKKDMTLKQKKLQE